MRTKNSSQKFLHIYTKICRTILIFILIFIISINIATQPAEAVSWPWSKKENKQEQVVLNPLEAKGEVKDMAADAQVAYGKKELAKHQEGIVDPLLEMDPEPTLKNRKERDWKKKQKEPGEKPKRVKELTEKRDAYSKSFLNDDGSEVLETALFPIHFKDGNSWKDIDNTLEKQGAEGKKYKTKANTWNVEFNTLSETSGISISDKKGALEILAQDTNTVDTEIIGTAPQQIVTYKDVWKGIDLEYEVRGVDIKENIIVKDPEAVVNYAFEFKGGTLKEDPKRKGWYSVESDLGSKFIIPSPTVATADKGVIGGEPIVMQTGVGSELVVSLDQEWLKTQPKESFPIVIDPTLTSGIGDNYVNFKSDGFICYANQGCGNTTGGLLHTNGQYGYWRFAAYPQYGQLQGKTLTYASLYLQMPPPQAGKNWGTYDARIVTAGHAQCNNNFNCYNPNIAKQSAIIEAGGEINVTSVYQSLINQGNWGGWLFVSGEEINGYHTRKLFDQYSTRVTFYYETPNTPAPMTTPVSPADKTAVVTTQPSFTVNKVNDVNGNAVSYYFRVATGANGETGAVANSGWITSPQWTVPDGVLQDGSTYYWRVYTSDGLSETPPNWTRSFRVDMRTGKDSTQSFDTTGPFSIDLATGNLSTSISTHSSSALGGSLGVSLDYNSPARSRPGLVGEYFNDSNQNKLFDENPTAIRVDQNIDFNWSNGSPDSGRIASDRFLVRWTGYLTAPTTGTYQFGVTLDDNVKIYFDDQLYADLGCCGANLFQSNINLQAGKPVKIKVEYVEELGDAALKLHVRGAVSEQVVPESWLQTGVRPVGMQHGLIGRYMNDSGDHSFPGNDNDLFMQRLDNHISFRWDNGSPIPSGPTNQFKIRWTGFITVPVTGEYNFGALSDDGIRIRINDALVHEVWRDSASEVHFGSGIQLTAGQSIPITVEYYENQGGAAIDLLVRGAVTQQVVPATWLTPKANILPEGWELSIDADGDLSYDRIKVSSTSAILTDSTGSTHEYTWTGSAYKPPVNEDGTLVRNADGTFTLQDVDGRTYVFGIDGKLVSSVTPLDDRKPAALKYEYAGSPSKLVKIVDGVTVNRFATLHYSGDNVCANAPTGFDTNAPAGMLCALKTNDGRTTKFWYKDGRLSRMEEPGNELTDWGYDSLGRIIQMREPLANDAILAGVRTQDDSVTAQIEYDVLGRALGVTLPAANTGASRMKHSYEYFNGYTLNRTQGAVEPHGFSGKVEYDSTFRTIKTSDIANLSSLTEWHSEKDLVLSTTDPTGLKSTTVYDHNDRPIDSYGPAPSAWFGSDRKPLTTYVNQVPRVETKYDEGIKALAVTYYDNKNLSGAPKLHGTGINGVNGDVWKTWNATPPVTPINGWGARMSGEIFLAEAGTHTFEIYSDDGVRLYINDQAVINDWTDGSFRTRPYGTFNNTNPNTYHRFRIDYYDKEGNDARIELHKASPGAGFNGGLGNLLSPRYGLQTSATAYDSTLGNSVSKTTYANPELGLATSTQLDPGGLNYSSTASYETLGSGFLRQTSRVLPGGTTTTYTYWNAEETADNPCTVEVESFKQAGMLKRRTGTDPDGTGGAWAQYTDSIYDDSGRIIASKRNDDPWTCTYYDNRGRTTKTDIPGYGGKSGRTITNNWAVDGNPLKVSTTDPEGTMTTINDLLGRTVVYGDAFNALTYYTYDALGRLIQKSGEVGTEVFVYNNYSRLIEQKLDGVVIAVPQYDQYGRIASVSYPTAGTMALTGINRDNLGRTTGMSYRFGDNTTISDSVTQSQSGQILTQTTNGKSYTYSYDKAGRLTGSTLGSDQYTYGFNTSTCTGSNANANKNSNRTTLDTVINGVSSNTVYCYDSADRLVWSSNPLISSPQYDEHQNTTQLGGGTNPDGSTAVRTEFRYDSSDRNTAVIQNGGEVQAYFSRDAQNRITYRHEDNNGSNAKDLWYGFTGAGDSPDFVRRSDWSIIEKYLSLPGGVLLTIKPLEADTSLQKTFSFSNLHSDIFATANALGIKTGEFAYDPFGNQLGTNLPDNTKDRSFGWVGSHQKGSEANFVLKPVQMGARVYIPLLGRFLQLDPIEGGVENDFVYPPDPVNDFDLDGLFSWKNIKQNVGRAWNSDRGQQFAHAAIGIGITALAATATTVCIASVVCGVGMLGVGAVGLVVVGTTAHYSLAKYGSTNQNYKNKSLSTWALSSTKSVATGIVCGAYTGAGCATGFIKPKPGSIAKIATGGIKGRVQLGYHLAKGYVKKKVGR